MRRVLPTVTPATDQDVLAAPENMVAERIEGELCLQSPRHPSDRWGAQSAVVV